ncbi:hypothetical protein POM88_009771 [Heracleum sosnowskyi]|uniref:Uncharacterized protein n=1 Tax=Heracleum sosnowskyi TaxID=360622 RepID=A0AAD8J9S1_9APIA|nr:hypothetical protein POM88_009771 [Heracleum sosnowskyi]
MGPTKGGSYKSIEVSSPQGPLVPNPQESNPVDQNPNTEQVPISHDDERVIIKMNRYKYTDVQVNPELISHLSPDELADVVRLYNTTILKQTNQNVNEDSEGSKNCQRSQRSVFDRIGDKGKNKETDKTESQERGRNKDKKDAREKIQMLRELKEKI